jgi:predicted transcriptional regulator
MKTEVYSWRLSSEFKSELEREARRRKTTLSSLLESAIRDWLKQSTENTGHEEEQRRLHAAAASSFGAFAGHNPRRAETARKAIRERLGRRHAR